MRGRALFRPVCLFVELIHVVCRNITIPYFYALTSPHWLIDHLDCFGLQGGAHDGEFTNESLRGPSLISIISAIEIFFHHHYYHVNLFHHVISQKGHPLFTNCVSWFESWMSCFDYLMCLRLVIAPSSSHTTDDGDEFDDDFGNDDDAHSQQICKWCDDAKKLCTSSIYIDSHTRVHDENKSWLMSCHCLFLQCANVECSTISTQHKPMS